MLDALFPILTAFITAVLGVITIILSKRKRHLDKTDEERAAEIVQAASAQAEEHRTRALERLAERLPAGTTSQEFLNSLERIVADLGATEARETRDDPTWSLVQDLVNSYHRQALDQARIQFWFSIVAAVVGFALIINGVLTSDDKTLDLILRSLPGVTVDAVAALFFKQAAETRERATALYDRLRTDNQQSQAITVVNSIEDSRVRSVVKAQLALHMAGIQSNPGDLSALLLRGIEAKD